MSLNGGIWLESAASSMSHSSSKWYGTLSTQFRFRGHKIVKLSSKEETRLFKCENINEHVIFMIPAKWRSNANAILVIYVDFDIQLLAGILSVKPL